MSPSPLSANVAAFGVLIPVELSFISIAVVDLSVYSTMPHASN